MRVTEENKSENTDKTLTFFTPSYRLDVERFNLLHKSIRRFYRGNARHIVVVPKEDVSVFKKISCNENIEILIQNDFVASMYYPRKWYSILSGVFPRQSWRLRSFAGRQGWIIQQIVKLSLPEIVKGEVAVIIDSDAVFIRPFDNSDLEIVNGKKVLVRKIPETDTDKHPEMINKARGLLGLPGANTEHHYMSTPNIWYPDWVKKLREHLEQINGKPWQKALYDADGISDYSLYGVFIEEILRPPELSVRLRPFHYSIWDRKSFERFFFTEWIPDNDPICIVIQSNLGIPVHQYSKKIESLWNSAN